jgi:hypothetical protein
VDRVQLDNLHIRPRFSFTVSIPKEELLEKFRKRLKGEECKCEGYVALHHVVLRVPYDDQHYWSPQLQFSVDEMEDDQSKSEIRGLVGPQPAVWTLFVFIYSFIGITGTFASLFGLSKWTLGEYSVFIWALPGTIILSATAYLVSKFGQRLGHDQIEVLSGFLQDTLSQTVLEK